MFHARSEDIISTGIRSTKIMTLTPTHHFQTKYNFLPFRFSLLFSSYLSTFTFMKARIQLPLFFQLKSPLTCVTCYFLAHRLDKISI